MLNFVPNIVVLDYLTAVDELDSSTKATATKFLLSGYQRELTYRRNDGSFSVFGKNDLAGSTWLTAFVAKSFIQAGAYVDIDSNIIDEALNFLSENQASDGSFPEIGMVYDKAMQGGSSNGLALTAYTAIAFLKNKVSAQLVVENCNKFLNFHTRNQQIGSLRKLSPKPSITLYRMSEMWTTYMLKQSQHMLFN